MTDREDLSRAPPRRRNRAWYLLLAPPYLANLWVASYDRVEPSICGMPFFYWYQLLWVLIAALLTGVVYLATADRD